MKKQHVITTLLFLTICFCLSGCHSSDKIKGEPADTTMLSGVWTGCGSALGKDGSYRCEYLNLTIGSDASFYLTDIEKSATTLSGTIYEDSDTTFQIGIDTDEKESMPRGWEDLNTGDTLSWQIPEEHFLILTYNDISYLFERQSSERAYSSDSLFFIADNDVWYCDNPDSNSYQLALYDRYAELYCILPDGSAEIVTNFLLLSKDGDVWHLCTSRSENENWPEYLDSLPEGISVAEIQFSSDDETLTMDYHGQKMTFKNNVIYDSKTGTTEEKVNNPATETTEKTEKNQ